MRKGEGDGSPLTPNAVSHETLHPRQQESKQAKQLEENDASESLSE